MQDAVPKPRLRTRSGATEDNPLLPQPAADKPAGCAVPLIFEVSEGQRKKELALGISVRTSVGDSEEFESDTLEFMPGSQVRCYLNRLIGLSNDPGRPRLSLNAFTYTFTHLGQHHHSDRGVRRRAAGGHRPHRGEPDGDGPDAVD